MEKIKLTINNKEIETVKGTTVLQAAEDNNIHIPTLCFMKDMNEIAACRMCISEFDGMGLKPTCTLEASAGMNINTNSKAVISSRVNTLELLASYHTFECWTCAREDTCNFYDMLQQYNVDDKYKHEFNINKKSKVVNSALAITLDSSKCVHCASCIAICNEEVGLGILDFVNRGFETIIAPTNSKESLDEVDCTSCGMCTKVCPTAAIYETDHTRIVQDKLNDPSYYVVAQVDPVVRATIAEEFGYEIGTFSTSIDQRFIASLHKIGFDKVIFSDDGTKKVATEIAKELTEHVRSDELLIRCCSEAAIEYVEKHEPAFIKNLSHTKSPAFLQGQLYKQTIKEENRDNTKNIFVVALSPCVAHKKEMHRPEMEVLGVKDIDAVLTTREVARVLKYNQVSLVTSASDSKLDDFPPLNESVLDSGLLEKVITEFASANNYEEKVKIEWVKCTEHVKEATVTIAKNSINVAYAFGGEGFKEIFKLLKGETVKKYHYIELLACNKGCLNGSGQPIVREQYISKMDITKLRAHNISKSLIQ